MRNNRYVLLIIAAAIALGAAYWASRSRAPQTEVMVSAELVPGLSAAINEVTKVTVTGAGGETLVTLNRGADAWTIEQKDNYPAETGKLRKFLLVLADASLVEKKSARVENHAALGVEDVAAADASGIRLQLEGVPGGDFIVGKTTRGSSASYVRKSDDPQAWVADKNIRFDKSLTAWLDKDVIDINAARIVSVNITHPDGKALTATRGDVNFAIGDLPAGKVLSSATAANSLADILDGLKMTDVRALAALEMGETKPVAVTFITAEGIVVEAQAMKIDDAHYATFSSRAEPSLARNLEPAAEPDPSTPADSAGEGEAAAVATPDPAAIAAASNESEKINARVSGWAYKIPQYKYEQMTRTIDDFVQDAD